MRKTNELKNFKLGNVMYRVLFSIIYFFAISSLKLLFDKS